MTTRLKLESFDFGLAPDESDDAESVADAEIEEVRLSAYEKGYSAGWEDSSVAQKDEQNRIHEDLARSFADLSFTYHEARAHVLSGLEPLLRGMVDRILPVMVRDTIGASIVAEITAAADHLASAPIALAIAPSNRGAVEAALADIGSLPVTITEDDTLGEGQAQFRFGEEERALDLDALVGAIRTLVTQFLETPDEERLAAHG